MVFPIRELVPTSFVLFLVRLTNLWSKCSRKKAQVRDLRIDYLHSFNRLLKLPLQSPDNCVQKRNAPEFRVPGAIHDQGIVIVTVREREPHVAVLVELPRR